MLKLFGVLLLFCACAAFGYFKSAALFEKAEALRKIILALDMLSIRISSTNEELPKAISMSFCDCDFLKIESGKILTLKSSLKPQDIKPLKELFFNLGNSNTQSEISKISLCKTQLEKQFKQAQKNYNEGSKLWQTLGVCTGLALGIMVI